jgi:tetratricopeptide (TPR) repeat protein
VPSSDTAPADASSGDLSKIRHWGFRVAALAAPFLVVALFELTLRFNGRHQATGFWLDSQEPGWIESNPAFGIRFVGPTLARLPRPNRVRLQKPADTVRILVLGESAALGDPEPAFGLPRFLQAQLEARFPQRRFEVINAGITALNSFALRDIARESRRLGADFWVVYPGNNEVHGPFGPGSGLAGETPSRLLILGNLALRRTAIGQWIASLRAGGDAGLSMTQRFAGLEMFTQNRVPATDPRLPRVRDHFSANLADIVRAGTESGAQVILGTMAVNLVDSPPFASEESLLTNSPTHRAWLETLDAARKSEEQADPAVTVTAWEKGVALTPNHAESRYRLGLARLNAGDSTAGRADLEAARDLDSLRFRADSGINAAIRSVAESMKSEHLLLVDPDRDLRGEDPGRPPGADLFYEHVHLRPEGNYRLARLFSDPLIQRLAGAETNPPSPRLETCLDRLGWVPQADTRIWTQIRSLVRRPPFSLQSNHESRDRFIDDRLAEATAEARRLGLNGALQRLQATLEAHPEDWELREQTARLQHLGRRWTNAAVEWQRIVAAAPGHVVAWYQLGEARAKSDDRPGAIEAYRHALKIRPDFTDAGLGLGIVLGQSGRLAEALEVMDRTLSHDPSHLEARINRGITLNALGRASEADADLRRAAAEHPESGLPLLRLADAQSARKEFLPAAETLSLALRREPGNPTLHHRLATELGRAGKLSESEAAFRRTLQVDPSYISARVDLGVALAQQRRFSDAIIEFEAALRQQPGHPTATTYLERARQMLQMNGAR